jgi:hypothetical protein
MFPMRAICPAHIINHNLIILIIFHEVHNYKFFPFRHFTPRIYHIVHSNLIHKLILVILPHLLA